MDLESLRPSSVRVAMIPLSALDFALKRLIATVVSWMLSLVC